MVLPYSTLREVYTVRTVKRNCTLGYKGIMKNSNDRYAEMAMDAYHEVGWELHPGEVRENLDTNAKEGIELWLRTGRTDRLR